MHISNNGLLTALMLTFQGSFLEPIWRINPDARQSFMSMGGWAILLMGVVGVACLLHRCSDPP